MYNISYMAKRATGVGKNRTTRNHKTKKRLEIKKAMLEDKSIRKKNSRAAKKI